MSHSEVDNPASQSVHASATVSRRASRKKNAEELFAAERFPLLHLGSRQSKNQAQNARFNDTV